ncbi:recombinase family protein [Mesorhizobium sp. M4A.F.Ca.ET.050.02.1.1]|uniref:recombinase family protein n=1 Tax=Mesorhizobium sp. M4A.F.Ca.ET.050.02.1.1 TaxID=2496754 RepID=UPI000FC9CA7B|nr:recombinase family protein [Mesorhizobium sp. M4A.F.Ca.ET.050.02.1.1]RUX51743.1 recombinase family protein [Mesorhizobium sp. M4A.F.Ca.ET.050.02.1.1]
MKITSDHLARGAYIYIRQSTVDQLANNHESRRRQYGLADRARALGWTDVTVIDDDLGRSGSGVSRPGFEKLLAAICEGRVGAVFAIEVSRLARNGRDWHTLIEFCGLVGTVIVDEDGTYEPRHPNDRLLLGMKGTMSELELSLLRARSMEALKQKARRGELFFTVAVGYVKVGRDKIEMDPDLRVREAIGLVFTRFAEMQSIRQVFLSLRSDQIALPYINPRISGQQHVLWKPPVYTTVSNLLTNPVYAGAYAFGRTGSRTIIENGRKRIVRGRRKARSDWAVLLVDHHEGYLSWADFERNQRLIADNANGKGMMVRGPVRKGEALLAGLLRCGHCGRRLLVGYNGAKGDVGRYKCDATRSNPDGDPCISFGALRVDEAVGAEIVRLLQPLGVEAAIQAIAQREHQSGEKQRQIELALEQARYEAIRARRQYDTVDPENRLVAHELERRWNGALAAVRALEEELEALVRQRPAALSAEERQRLLQMGADLEAAWHHPAATAVTRKRIIRVVLREVVAHVEGDQIHLLLHWQGGDHTRLTVRKNRRGQTRWSVEPETVELIRARSRLMPDKAIAGLLNRAGKRTGRSNGWSQSRVRGFRNTHGIAVYRDGEWAERGEVTLTEAARMLNLSSATVLRQIRAGIIPAQQYCKGAPWVIKRRNIEDSHLIEHAGPCLNGPSSSNLEQKTFVFQ